MRPIWRGLSLGLACVVVFAVACSNDDRDFVSALRDKSSNAEEMSTDEALAWGEIVCTTLYNGGSRADAESNIDSTNADSEAVGDIPLDDVRASAVVDLARVVRPGPQP